GAARRPAAPSRPTPSASRRGAPADTADTARSSGSSDTTDRAPACGSRPGAPERAAHRAFASVLPRCARGRCGISPHPHRRRPSPHAHLAAALERVARKLALRQSGPHHDPRRLHAAIAPTEAGDLGGTTTPPQAACRPPPPRKGEVTLGAHPPAPGTTTPHPAVGARRRPRTTAARG